MPNLPRDQPDPNSRYITFGSGIRLLSEDRLLSDLSTSGLDRKALRQLCRALCVPALRVGGLRYYDFFTLVLAMKHVLRWGAPDFWAEAEPLPLDLREQYVNALDPERLSSHLPQLIEELLAARELSGITPEKTFREVRTGLLRAARRLADIRKTQTGQPTSGTGGGERGS